MSGTNAEATATAEGLFGDALVWLGKTYSEHRFFLERDLVWTLQRHIIRAIEEHSLPYRVYGDYPMPSGLHRSQSADVAILDDSNTVLLAAEFTYEPDHKRVDYPVGRFPLCPWGDIEKDWSKVKRFVRHGKAQVAYAVLVDEGGYFRTRVAPGGVVWLRWSSEGRPKAGALVLRVSSGQENGNRNSSALKIADPGERAENHSSAVPLPSPLECYSSHDPGERDQG
jgi:hypothetical protein